MTALAPVDAIIICGRGESAHRLDLWHAQLKERFGDSLYLWGMNERTLTFETHHFEMHSPRHHPTTTRDRPWFLHWQQDLRLPNERHYPKDWVREQNGIWCCVSSALSYMLALAAALRPKVLALPGCDLRAEREHKREHERGDAQFWLGILHERGCRFMIDERSLLLPRKEYH